MITPVRKEYIKGITIRHYQASTITEAIHFADKWKGELKALKVDGRAVYGVKISNQN